MFLLWSGGWCKDYAYAVNVLQSRTIVRHSNRTQLNIVYHNQTILFISRVSDLLYLQEMRNDFKMSAFKEIDHYYEVTSLKQHEKRKFRVALINKCNTHGIYGHQYSRKITSLNIICCIVVLSVFIENFSFFFSLECRTPFSCWMEALWDYSSLTYIATQRPRWRFVTTNRVRVFVRMGHWPIKSRHFY